MAIRVRCRNPECNKLLTVPDEAAGTKSRCPRCNSAVRIPGLELDRDDDEDEDEDRPRSQKRRRDRDREEDEEDRPRRRKKRVPDDDEDEDEDERDEPSSKKPHPCTGLNLVQFLGGVALLLGLAFMPLLPWIQITGEMEIRNKDTGSVTVTGLGKVTGTLPDAKTGKMRVKEGNLADKGRPEGLLLMVTALTVNVLALIAFVLAMTGVLGRQASRHAATAAILVLVMVSVLLLLWQLTWVWKMLTLTEVIRKEAGAQIVGAKAGTVTISARPALGLFIGLGLAAAAAFVFSNLASRVSRTLWCRLAEVAGLLLAGLVLVLVVRAWEAQALWDAIQAL